MNIQSGNELNTSQEDKPMEKQPPEQSGWSAIPIKKNESLERSVDESQEVEQLIYSAPDTPPPSQETGGPDKPTA